MPTLLPVLLVTGIDALGFSIVLPFLVYVVTGFGGNAFVYGALAATFPACQLLAAPILGRWSDRSGRRPVLLASELGTAAAWGLFVIALALPATPLATVHGRIVGSFTLTVPLVVLFVARACDGLTGGNVSVANAYVADVTAEEERSAAFGKMGVASSVGFVVGPAIAGLMGRHYGAAAGLALALSLGAAVLVVLRLPESLKRAAPRTAPEPSRWRDAWLVPHVPWLLLLYFTAYAGFTVFQAAFPAYAATGLGWSVRRTGVLFTVLSATLALVQGQLTGRLAKKVSNTVLVVGGACVLGVGLLLFTSRLTAVLYGAAILYATGTGLMWPPLLAVIANVAGSRQQGAVQGLAGAAGGAASMAGLVLGGALYETIGRATFVVASAAIFASAAMGLRIAGFERPPR
jgi:DHA1 family tetracycline resistance protein-like MFS transporter